MISMWHILVIALVVFVFFGAGRLPRLMGDLAEGIKAFKKGMKEGEEEKKLSSSSSSDKGE